MMMMLTEYMMKLADEMHAASAYICEHGKIEIGTPQSRRLIETVQMGRQFGVEPTIPADYPMNMLSLERASYDTAPVGSRTRNDFSIDLMTGRKVDP